MASISIPAARWRGPALLIAFLAGTALPVAAEGFLYFNNFKGSLHRSDFFGGNVTSAFSPAPGSGAEFLAVDHDAIYFINQSANTLSRMNLDGTGAAVLTNISAPTGLALTQSGNLLISAFGIPSGVIQQYNPSTGTLTPRFTGLDQPRGIETHGSAVYWIEAGRDALVSSGGIDLATIPAAAGTLFDLVRIEVPLPDLLFYLTSRERVYRVLKPLIGPPTITTAILGNASSDFTGITASHTTVYVNAKGEDRIYTIALANGAVDILHDPTTVAGLSQPAGIALTPIPEVTIDDAVAHESAHTVPFTVRLSRRTGCDVQLSYATSDNSALAPFDYAATSGLLTIPAGEIAATIDVPVVNDGTFEADETFRLTLSNLNFGLLTDSEALATITSRSSIVGGQRHTWGQNIAWTTWSSPDGTGWGAHTLTTHLAGKVWNQNVGWINLGNGSPGNGVQYSQLTAADTGVNLLPDGSLTGYAWGQNIGWINFEQTHGKPRLDYGSGQFSGFAWSQNCGWINLGTGTSSYLQSDLLEIVDSDHDMIDDGWELQRVAAAGRSTGSPAGDLVLLGKTGNADTDPLDDLAEFEHDSDPFDPASFTKIVQVTIEDAPAPREVAVTWTSSPARLYDLQESPDHLVPFADLFTDLPGEPGTTTATWLAPATPERSFWKVGAKRPLTPQLP